MENAINAQEIGYTSYNKLNMLSTFVIISTAIVFAIFGDRISLKNGKWDTISIIIFICTLSIYGLYNIIRHSTPSMPSIPSMPPMPSIPPMPTMPNIFTKITHSLFTSPD